MTRALIFDIKRFGVNDGSGIRTVLFIKGCPLCCRWCQNPEGLYPQKRLWWMKTLCVGCKSCLQACKTEGALSFDETGLRIDENKCVCGASCIDACPSAALRFDAREMSVEEALNEIEKDRPFYGAQGGVTLSGGECTCSEAFSLALLQACRARGISTAIESCLYAKEDVIDRFAFCSDEIIADIKLMDEKRHLAATGKGNALILKNIRRLAEKGVKLRLRTPLIPSFTADRENLEEIADFVASLPGKVPFELLNYNPMCREKYAALRQNYPIPPEVKAFNKEEMKAFRHIFESRGVDIEKE